MNDWRIETGSGQVRGFVCMYFFALLDNTFCRYTVQNKREMYTRYVDPFSKPPLDSCRGKKKPKQNHSVLQAPRLFKIVFYLHTKETCVDTMQLYCSSKSLAAFSVFLLGIVFRSRKCDRKKKQRGADSSGLITWRGVGLILWKSRSRSSGFSWSHRVLLHRQIEAISKGTFAQLQIYAVVGCCMVAQVRANPSLWSLAGPAHLPLCYAFHL